MGSNHGPSRCNWDALTTAPTCRVQRSVYPIENPVRREPAGLGAARTLTIESQEISDKSHQRSRFSQQKKSKPKRKSRYIRRQLTSTKVRTTKNELRILFKQLHKSKSAFQNNLVYKEYLKRMIVFCFLTILAVFFASFMILFLNSNWSIVIMM